MKKILAFCSAAFLSIGVFAQIVNPTAPTQAGTGLSKTGNSLNVVYGTTAGTSTQGNDSRLSNPAVSPTTLTAHGVLVGNGASAINATTAGTAGQCLISNGASSDPTFQACSAGGSGVVNSGTAGQMTYYAGTGNTVSGTANATISSGALTLGVPTSVLGTIGLSGNTSGTVTVQPQAVAGTYNFNLPTGAGTAGQPLLSGGGGAAAQTYGTLGVAAGGTGATTLTAHGVVVGNGTTAVNVTSAGTSGQCLVSNGASSDPTFQACGTGGTVTVPNGGTGTTTLTNHGVMLGQGTSAVVVTSAGTAGQVLTSNGASADPTFQAVASGGLTLISSTTFSGSANMDLLSSFSSTYDNYRLSCTGILPSANNVLSMQFAVGGAADSTSNYVVQTAFNAAGGSTATSIGLTDTIIAAGTGYNLVMDIFNVNDATNAKFMTVHGHGQSTVTPTWTATIKEVGFVKAAAVTGVHMFVGSGTVSAKCKLYGYAN